MAPEKILAPPPPATFPPYISSPWAPLHKGLFDKVVDLLLEKGFFFNGTGEDNGAFKFKPPEELQQIFDFSLKQTGVDHKTLFHLMEQVVRYSQRRSHPFFLDKLGSGLNPYAVAADWVGSVMSSANVSYFFGPVLTIIQEEIKRRMRRLIGYPNGTGDGVVCPGGGFACLLAVRLALHNKFPEVKDKGFLGVGSPKIRIFISDQTNMFPEKAAIICGIGSDAFVQVKSDRNGRLIMKELEEAVKTAKEENAVPVMVIGIAGTAALGAIDPLAEIAQFCKENKIWFHIEGNYGGSYIFTRETKDRLKGIEDSDSFTWSPSDTLGIPFCSSMVVTRYKDSCELTFGNASAYVSLFETKLFDPKWNTGDATVQCSRRGDALKLWYLWKTQDIPKMVSTIEELADTFVRKLKERPAFHTLLDEYETARIAFYYVPEAIRDHDRSKDYENPLMKRLTVDLKTKLLKEKRIELGVSRMHGFPDFFTVSVTNDNFQPEEMDKLLDIIEAYGSGQSHNVKAAIQNSNKELTARDRDAKEFLRKAYKMIEEKGLYFQNKRNENSYNFLKPSDLIPAFDFALDTPPITDHAELVKILEDFIFYSIHHGHPYNVFQLVSNGLDAYASMGEFISGVMTSPMINYEDSPVYHLMERELFRASREIIGFPADGDGMLNPGGSISIISAVYIARYSKFPETKKTGITGDFKKRLVCYLSENAHYCFRKGTILQGIGIENCINIGTDERGGMSISALRAAVRKTLDEGGIPFLVEATAGTTILGAFDPINEIADVCQEFGMWLHVDGSVGGSVIFSEAQRKLRLKGLDRVDSFNYNPHKMLGAPEEVSVILFKKRNIIRDAFGVRDPLPFQSFLPYNQREYDNPGQGGLQVERRPQILKFWLMWKAKGANGLGQHVDHIYDLTAFATEELKKRSDRFQIWFPEFESPNVLFLYIPLKLRHLDRKSKEYLERVDNVADQLFIDLIKDGIMQIGIEPDRGSPLLLKFVFFNSSLTYADVLYLLDQVDNYGKELDV